MHEKTNLHRVLAFYNDAFEKYDDVYEKEDWRLYNDLTWHFMEPFLPPVPSDSAAVPCVLDLGTGTGKWAITLAKLGYQVTCTDISPRMLEVAREKASKAGLDEQQIIFMEEDARNVNAFPRAMFDLVLALGDVISYAIDDDMVVKTMHHACKVGGTCIASVDNTFTYIVNEIKNERWDKIDQLLETNITDFFPPHPIRTFLPAQLVNLFERHGFSVLHLAGKPVLSNAVARKIRRRKLALHYERVLELEQRFGANPAFVGHGGHLQITAKK